MCVNPMDFIMDDEWHHRDTMSDESHQARSEHRKIVLQSCDACSLQIYIILLSVCMFHIQLDVLLFDFAFFLRMRASILIIIFHLSHRSRRVPICILLLYIRHERSPFAASLFPHRLGTPSFAFCRCLSLYPLYPVHCTWLFVPYTFHFFYYYNIVFRTTH